MSDVFTKAKRSEIMTRIRGKNTKPEIIVRSMLHRLGYRFRIHDPKLPGKPDIVLKKYQSVILVHGCFWHQHKGCRKATIPESNRAFWEKKLNGNVNRDLVTIEKLKRVGLKVCIVWECETRQIDLLERRLLLFLSDDK